MEQSIITFQADEQQLVKTGGADKFASSTVAYVEAQFTLGTNWTGFDSVRAMWRFGSDVMATVLAIENGVGVCQVPHELLEKRGELKVNLVGSIVEDEVISDRLTTFPIVALIITKVAMVTSDETEVTPSQFEQFVAIVKDDADRAEDARDDAESAETNAETAQGKAEDAQGLAEQARDTAQGYAESASGSADRAEQAEQSILGLSATAEVDANVGTPSVGVSVSEVGGNKVMAFDFHNLKGVQGETGEAAGFGTVSATVDANVGTPSVEVTESGSATAKNFAFAFHNLKGVQGETGNGIISTELISTVGAVKTYRQTYADGTHFDYEVTDGEVTNASLAEVLEGYLPMDGYSESAGVGTADNLTTNTGLDDETPFSFRTTGGSADVGDRKEVHELVGYDIAWNQLMKALSTTDWGVSGQRSMSVSDGVLTIIQNGEASHLQFYTNLTNGFVVGHKYLVCTDIKPTFDLLMGIRLAGTSTTTNAMQATANVWNTYQVITNCSAVSSSRMTFYIPNDYLVNGSVSFKNAMMTDLTLMFGSTIADYVYSLETAQSGSGIQWLKDRGFFTKPYYAYQAGKLEPVETDESITVGFNQFDKNSARTTGSYKVVDVPIGEFNELYMTLEDNDTSVDISGINIGFAYNTIATGYRWIVANGVVASYAPTNVAYNGVDAGKLCKYVIVYPNTDDAWNKINKRYNICVNIRWDGSRDGEYEAYQKRTYSLGHSTLHGILKIDANGNLYADGDVRRPDGSKSLRYGIVDLGTLEWVAYSDIYYANIPGKAYLNSNADIVCGAYSVYPTNQTAATYANSTLADKQICGYRRSAGTSVSSYIYLKDSAYLTAEALTTALDGVYLVYELATPTETTDATFQETQIVSDFGTEYLTDYAYENGTRDVEIPVGHNTFYPYDLKAKLEMAPNSPEGAGDYIVRQTNGTNEYVSVGDNATIQSLLARNPVPSGSDGTYVLKATISGGAVTYTWVAE